MEITGPAADVPFLTTEQMIEVDRAMIDDYGIELRVILCVFGEGASDWSGLC